MKRFLRFSALLIVVLCALAALAVDLTGDWSGASKGPNGEDFTLSLKLKQEGATLTGTVNGPDGNPIDITDGKVDGDKISFNVSVNNMTIAHEGVIKGDNEIALTAKFPQGSNVADMQMDLKRVK
jgi:hypothetical protein